MKLLKAISSPIIGKFYCCFSSISHKTSAIQLIRREICVQRKSNLINYRSKICYSSRKIRMKKINNNFSRLSSTNERESEWFLRLSRSFRFELFSFMLRQVNEPPQPSRYTVVVLTKSNICCSPFCRSQWLCCLICLMNNNLLPPFNSLCLLAPPKWLSIKK